MARLASGGVFASAVTALSLSLQVQSPASAASCPTGDATTVPTPSVTYATLFSPSTPFSCTIGDLTFKNFKTPSADLTTKAPVFWWQQQDSDTINFFFGSTTTFSASAAGKSYTFAFEVAAAPGKYVSSWGLSRTVGTSPNSSNTTLSLVAPPYGAGPATASLNQTLAFTASATLRGTTSNSRIFQAQFNQAEVPGPIPLLAAPVAFAFSRKMRRRIRSLT